MGDIAGRERDVRELTHNLVARYTVGEFDCRSHAPGSIIGPREIACAYDAMGIIAGVGKIYPAVRIRIYVTEHRSGAVRLQSVDILCEPLDINAGKHSRKILDISAEHHGIKSLAIHKPSPVSLSVKSRHRGGAAQVKPLGKSVGNELGTTLTLVIERAVHKSLLLDTTYVIVQNLLRSRHRQFAFQP